MLLLIHIISDDTFDEPKLAGHEDPHYDELLFMVSPRGYRKPCPRA